MSCPTTRRFARSLPEAFGPHTSRVISEAEPKADLATKVMYVIGVIAVIVIWWTN